MHSPAPPQHIPADTVVFATSATSGIWWLVGEVLAHGPSWSVVPPLLLSTAALVGAVRSWRTERETWLDRQQSRKQAAELHALEVARQRSVLGVERLPDRI